MKKLVLAGISVLAVVLLILGSHANAVGYQIVKTSQLQHMRNQRTLIVKSFASFVRETTFLARQNASFLHFLFFMIGFLFGLITLVPAAMYYFCVVVIFMIVFVELYYGKVTFGVILSVLVKGIILWLAFLLDYLLYCGFLFQDKLIHFFEGTPFVQRMGHMAFE